ncbi:unnamed protein product, partial [Symbiodinium natans]
AERDAARGTWCVVARQYGNVGYTFFTQVGVDRHDAARWGSPSALNREREEFGDLVIWPHNLSGMAFGIRQLMMLQDYRAMNETYYFFIYIDDDTFPCVPMISSELQWVVHKSAGGPVPRIYAGLLHCDGRGRYRHDQHFLVLEDSVVGDILDRQSRLVCDKYSGTSTGGWVSLVEKEAAPVVWHDLTLDPSTDPSNRLTVNKRPRWCFNSLYAGDLEPGEFAGVLHKSWNKSNVQGAMALDQKRLSCRGKVPEGDLYYDIVKFAQGPYRGGLNCITDGWRYSTIRWH